MTCILAHFSVLLFCLFPLNVCSFFLFKIDEQVTEHVQNMSLQEAKQQYLEHRGIPQYSQETSFPPPSCTSIPSDEAELRKELACLIQAKREFLNSTFGPVLDTINVPPVCVATLLSFNYEGCLDHYRIDMNNKKTLEDLSNVTGNFISSTRKYDRSNEVFMNQLRKMILGREDLIRMGRILLVMGFDYERMQELLHAVIIVETRRNRAKSLESLLKKVDPVNWNTPKLQGCHLISYAKGLKGEERKEALRILEYAAHMQNIAAKVGDPKPPGCLDFLEDWVNYTEPIDFSTGPLSAQEAVVGAIGVNTASFKKAIFEPAGNDIETATCAGEPDQVDDQLSWLYILLAVLAVGAFVGFGVLVSEAHDGQPSLA